MTDHLGEPEELGEALEDLEGGSVADDPGGGGPFSGLGPLANTEPNPQLEDLDAPEVSTDHARKLAYRGFLKLQGGAMAITDFLMAGVIGTMAMFSVPDGEESEQQEPEPQRGNIPERKRK